VDPGGLAVMAAMYDDPETWSESGVLATSRPMAWSTQLSPYGIRYAPPSDHEINSYKVPDTPGVAGC
jgi:hypothetical protein